jgi:hypothetical protein
MNITKDGGPAFPTANGGSPDDGMTLRDYFAVKAMEGFICEPVEGVQEALFCSIRDSTCAVMATASYKMADAMLKERAK